MATFWHGRHGGWLAEITMMPRGEQPKWNYNGHSDSGGMKIDYTKKEEKKQYTIYKTIVLYYTIL